MNEFKFAYFNGLLIGTALCCLALDNHILAGFLLYYAIASALIRAIETSDLKKFWVYTIITFASAYYVKNDRRLKGDELSTSIKRRNLAYLLLSVFSYAVLDIMFRLENVSLCDVFILKQHWIPTVIFSFTIYILLSRVFHIFLAFYYDAEDKLLGTDSDSSLTTIDRMRLTLRSYLELIISFSLLYVYLGLVNQGNVIKGADSMLDSLYFSVITITTLGYGDINPITDVAKVLSMIEVLSGLTLIILALAIYISSAFKEANVKNDSCGSQERAHGNHFTGIMNQ